MVKAGSENNTYFLRTIHAINNSESIKIIQNMQKNLINLRHPNLGQYLVIAVESTEPFIHF